MGSVLVDLGLKESCGKPNGRRLRAGVNNDAAGMDDYVTKPIRVDAAVQALMHVVPGTGKGTGEGR